MKTDKNVKKVKDYAFKIKQDDYASYFLKNLEHDQSNMQSMSDFKRGVIRLKYAKNYQSKEPLNHADESSDMHINQEQKYHIMKTSEAEFNRDRSGSGCKQLPVIMHNAGSFKIM